MYAILGILALFASLTARAADYSEWPFRQDFAVPGPGLVKFSLPPATLDRARPDLGDLRLVDAAGKEVPYLIERAVPGDSLEQPARTVKIELVPGATVITLDTGLRQPVAGVTLLTPAVEFIKSAKVEASRDGRRWRALLSGQPIFRQSGGASQLRIALPAAVWPFLRLTVDDQSSPRLAFTGVQVAAAPAEPVPTEAVAVHIGERVENPGETRLTLDLGAAHLDLVSLAIDTPDPLFRRQVSVATRQVEENSVQEKVLASQTIFRVAVPGQAPSTQLSVPLDFQAPGRELLLLIDNADSPPLRITGVRAQRRPIHLVFFAPQAATYRLHMGNARCPAPRYDLAGQASDLRNAVLLPLTLPAPSANPGYRPPETLPQVQDSGTALDLAAWRFRKPVHIAQPGVQQLELDLEVLAAAQPGLADIRLLRNGRQLPFITEHSAIRRDLRPTVARADDPRRPRFSRWSLTVPRANLPLSRLSCVSATALFQREFALYEEAVDERGGTYRRQLGHATWAQSPDRAARTLSLPLHSRPLTATLFLETDNGDNPAIDLAAFEFTWPVSRLYFKTTATDGLFLAYGNPAAQAPRYDLSLVANHLVQADKHTAGLGTQQQLQPTPWRERHAARSGVLFWGVLGIVVAVLLFLIARLLPKPAPPAA